MIMSSGSILGLLIFLWFEPIIDFVYYMGL